MLVIVGLSVLLFVGVIVFVGVLSNAGVAPPAVRMRRGGSSRAMRTRRSIGAAAYLRHDLRPKLLASDAFSTTPPPARWAGSDAVSVLSRTTRPHLLWAVWRWDWQRQDQRGHQRHCSPTPLKGGGEEPPW